MTHPAGSVLSVVPVGPSSPPFCSPESEAKLVSSPDQLRVRYDCPRVWRTPPAASHTWALSPELPEPWRPLSTALPLPGGSVHKTKRAQGQMDGGSPRAGIPTPGLPSPPSTWAFRGGGSPPTRAGPVPAPGCLPAPGLASCSRLQVAGTTRLLCCSARTRGTVENCEEEGTLHKHLAGP